MPISCTEKEKHRHDRRLWKVIFRVFWGSTIIVPVAGKNSNWFQLRCNSIFTSVRQALQIFPQGRTACVLYISRYLHCIGGKVLWAQNCHTATKFSHHLFLSCQWMLQYIYFRKTWEPRDTRYRSSKTERFWMWMLTSCLMCLCHLHRENRMFFRHISQQMTPVDTERFQLTGVFQSQGFHSMLFH